MIRFVMIRHGQSTWNRENRFTGWVDVDLSERGVAEARDAGRRLQQEDFRFDIALTSMLKRAVRTLWLVQEELDQMYLKVDTDWRINERHYGALQGLNKKETARKHGEEQVHRWRRGYAIRPPALDPDDPTHPKRDPRYAGVADPPGCESLADTLERVIPWWEGVAKPLLAAGQRPLMVAHGNSMRALVKYLDGISDGDIMELNIPTGIPLVYELDRRGAPLRHYYLADTGQLEGRGPGGQAAGGRRGDGRPLARVPGQAGGLGAGIVPAPERGSVEPRDRAPPRRRGDRCGGRQRAAVPAEAVPPRRRRLDLGAPGRHPRRRRGPGRDGPARAAGGSGGAGGTLGPPGQHVVDAPVSATRSCICISPGTWRSTPSRSRHRTRSSRCTGSPSTRSSPWHSTAPSATPRPWWRCYARARTWAVSAGGVVPPGAAGRPVRPGRLSGRPADRSGPPP